MLKKLHLTYSVAIIFLLNLTISKAELQIPNDTILPAEVIKIQLIGLMNNDEKFNDGGIEQTWNFAHPENKKNTGPLPKFKMMIKSRSYQMLLNHLNHTITNVGSSDKWAQFEVIILDKEKIYHKFNWQVENIRRKAPKRLLVNHNGLSSNSIRKFNLIIIIQFCFVMNKNLVGIV